MVSVTALEAKTRFGRLLERVACGEEIVITRHERPVARLVPEGRANLKKAGQAAAALRELRRRIAARTAGDRKLTRRDVRAAVQEGRR